MLRRRQTRPAAVLALAVLFGMFAADAAQAQQPWPPWQSYGEAEQAARAKKRAKPSQAEIDAARKQVDQLRQAGKYAEATKAQQRVVKLTENRFGPNDAQTAAALTTLADLYTAQNKFAEAEPLLKRAITIREKAKKPDNNEIAQALDNLGSLYMKQGRTADAAPLAQRAADLRANVAATPAPPQAPAKEAEKQPKAAEKPAAATDEAAAPPAPPPAAPVQPPPATIGQGAPPPDTGKGGAQAPAEDVLPQNPLSALKKPAPAAPPAPPAPTPTVAPPAAPPPVTMAPPTMPPPPAAPSAPVTTMAPPAQPEVQEDRMEDSRVSEAEESRAAEEAAKTAEAEARRRALEEERRKAEAEAQAKRAAEEVATASKDTAERAVRAPLKAAPRLAPPAPSAPPVAEAPAPLPPKPPAAVTAAPPGAPAAAPPAADKPEEQKDWDVVPVFYGTDRAVEPNAQRLVFGSDRGRRLQLGQALVTVPKVHQVPQVERPWAVKIPYFDVTIYEQKEDPKQHFTIKEIKALTKEQLLALVKARLKPSQRFKEHALVFVHGYNTSFDNALYRTAQISYDLEFDGAAFLYSWPSGGGVASYTYDRESAQASEPYLRQFLEMVVKETGAKSVSVIAHSMGNQPLMDVLRDMKSATPEGVAISQLILAAPDVDADNFTNLAQAIKGFAKGVTLYASANDRALQVSRNFWGNYRAGDVPAAGPLVLPGIDSIDVTAASTDAFAINHSGYAENNKLLQDIGKLILNGLRPPDLRLSNLKKVSTDRGEYWRFVK